MAFDAVAPRDLVWSLEAAISAPPPQRARGLAETARRAVELAHGGGITRVADLTGLARIGVPVVAVMRPDALSLSVSSGKGTSLAAAYVSGLMESLELYYAERFAQHTPFRAMAECCEIADCENLPRVRDAPPIDLRALDDVEMSRGRDLFTDRPIAVPFDLVHAAFHPGWWRRGYGFLTSTNGLAGGNSRAEAALHALCEVIERDAHALFLATDPGCSLADRASLDWTSIDDTDCLLLLEHCRRAGFEPIIVDITSDIGVPTFYCRLLSSHAYPLHATDGCGCHPHPAAAIRRAVTESIQCRLLAISGARDDLRPGEYEEAREAWCGSAMLFQLEDVGAPAAIGIDAALAWVGNRLAKRGFDTAVAVDLSPAGSELTFLRVIVPGLEGSPHSRHYSPGARARRAARLRR